MLQRNLSSRRAHQRSAGSSHQALDARWLRFRRHAPACHEHREVARRPEEWLALYRAVERVRLLDHSLLNLSKLGTIGVYTPLHGQATAQVAAVWSLRATDWVVPTFREGAMAEVRNLPIAAPVASQIPHAMGLAWAERLSRTGGVAMCLLGDGATSKGDFHEGVNLAAVQRLPVIFYCQNNRWALSTPIEEQSGSASVAQKAIAYGIPGVQVDGDDPVSVLEVVDVALARARRGEGPTLVEALCQRVGPHGTSDNPSLYRREPADEPVVELGRWLRRAGFWKDEDEDRLGIEINEEVQRAVEWAESEAARLRRQKACDFSHVFASPTEELKAQAAVVERGHQGEPVYPIEERAFSLGRVAGERRTMVQALNRELFQLLQNDPDVVLLGEDVGRLGGVFRVSEGLMETFGRDRVVDTPLSESGIIGAAIGLAMAGKRPICEIQFGGFIYSAYDQLRSHASRFRARTRGRLTVPMVIRAPYGAGVGAPESHSDSVEMLCARIPGLKVAVASSPRRARALLRSAVYDPDPVVLLEPIASYRRGREVVPNEPESWPLGRASRLRAGSDLTLVSYGAMVLTALRAAGELARQGVEADVLDLVTLSPLDVGTVAASVQRTGRLLVLHEGIRTGDIGAELFARIHRAVGPQVYMERLCGWDCQLPFHGHDDSFVPDVNRVVAGAELLLRRS